MELLLHTAENKQELFYNWDISETDGIADSVPEKAEQDQEAAVVTYLETDTVPLLEDKGTDWAGFLLKRYTLAEIDTKVRENLKTYLNTVVYTPVYGTDKGALTVQIAKTIINTGAVG